MGKRKPTFKIYSFGEYEKWDRNSKAIPKIINFSTKIKAKAGTEFGYVLHVKQGKGETLTFEIKHPPFSDNQGNILPPFTGSQFIRTNDFQFYLGDCIWEPISTKTGKWELTTWYKNQIVAHKIFDLIK